MKDSAAVVSPAARPCAGSASEESAVPASDDVEVEEDGPSVAVSVAFAADPGCSSGFRFC